MLGQVTSVRIGNQKLISVDFIALFGLIGLLAAVGAILTHKFQGDEITYLNSFVPTNPVPLSNADFNYTCLDPTIQCDGYIITLTIDCLNFSAVPPAAPVMCVSPNSIDVTLDDTGFDNWNYTIQTFLPNFNPDNDNTNISVVGSVPGFYNRNDPRDFRLVFFPICQKWCDDTMWMYKLCVAVAGLCVGFSGLVFLYLYLGCILERLYPKRRLERLANILLMRGEEAPKLERINTSSKSESIRPDLKEY